MLQGHSSLALTYVRRYYDHNFGPLRPLRVSGSMVDPGETQAYLLLVVTLQNLVALMSYHVGVCWVPKILGCFVQLQVPLKFCYAPVPLLCCQKFEGRARAPASAYDKDVITERWRKRVIYDTQTSPTTNRRHTMLITNCHFFVQLTQRHAIHRHREADKEILQVGGTPIRQYRSIATTIGLCSSEMNRLVMDEYFSWLARCSIYMYSLCNSKLSTDALLQSSLFFCYVGLQSSNRRSLCVCIDTTHFCTQCHNLLPSVNKIKYIALTVYPL